MTFDMPDLIKWRHGIKTMTKRGSKTHILELSTFMEKRTTRPVVDNTEPLAKTWDIVNAISMAVIEENTDCTIWNQVRKRTKDDIPAYEMLDRVVQYIVDQQGGDAEFFVTVMMALRQVQKGIVRPLEDILDNFETIFEVYDLIAPKCDKLKDYKKIRYLYHAVYPPNFIALLQMTSYQPEVDGVANEATYDDFVQKLRHANVKRLNGQRDAGFKASEEYLRSHPDQASKDQAYAFRAGEIAKGADQTSGGCRFCGLKNHESNQCRKVTCYNCQEKGHLRDKCPSIRQSRYQMKSKQDGRPQQGNRDFKPARSSAEPPPSNWQRAPQAKMAFIRRPGAQSHEPQSAIADNGATSSVFPDYQFMIPETVKLTPGLKLEGAQKGAIDVIAKGTAVMRVLNTRDHNYALLTIQDALIVPDASSILLSINQLDSQKAAVAFAKEAGIPSLNVCLMNDQDTYVPWMTIEQHPDHGLIEVLIIKASADEIQSVTAPAVEEPYSKPVDETALYAQPTKASKIITSQIIHDRYGHPGRNRQKKLEAKMVDDGYTIINTNFECDSCDLAKSIPLPYKPVPDETPFKRGECFELDLSGIASIPTMDGGRYRIYMIDRKTGYTFCTILKTKNAQPIYDFVKYNILLSERITGNKVQRVKSDGGTEFTMIEKWCHSVGIDYRKSPPRTHQCNPRPEVKMRSSKMSMDCMMVKAGVPPEFWGHAAEFHIGMSNLTPIVRQDMTSKFRTPYEMFYELISLIVTHMFSKIIAESIFQMSRADAPCGMILRYSASSSPNNHSVMRECCSWMECQVWNASGVASSCRYLYTPAVFRWSIAFCRNCFKCAGSENLAAGVNAIGFMGILNVRAVDSDHSTCASAFCALK